MGTKNEKKLTCRVKHTQNPNLRIITFEASVLPALCRMLKVPFDPYIIAFTKKGVYKNNLPELIKLADEMDKKK